MNKGEILLKLLVLEEKICLKREELNKIIIAEPLDNQEILQLSHEMDTLINEYSEIQAILKKNNISKKYVSDNKIVTE